MSNSDTSKSDAKSEKGFTQVKHQLHIQKKSWQKQSPQNGNTKP